MVRLRIWFIFLKRIALDMGLELFHIGVDVFLWYAQEDIVWGVADEDR